MVKLPAEIVGLIDAEKSLGAKPNWDDKSDPKYIVFAYPLTIDGMVTGGFQLRFKISKTWVDRDAVAQLEYRPAGKRSALPLWRIEWRPISPHTNAGMPDDLKFTTIEGTHHHPFLENYLPADQRMREGNLPAARPIDNDLNTLSDFLACVGKIFRIRDVELVEIPTISADWLWTDQ